MPKPLKQRIARRGFSAIEILAALFLAGLLAGLATVSLSGPRRIAKMDEVVERFAMCDRLARYSARSNAAGANLVLTEAGDVMTETAGSADEPSGAPHVLYRLPSDFRFARMMAGAGDERFDRLIVRLGRSGLSESYAVQVIAPEQSRWLVVAGFSGQLIEAKDESEVSTLLACGAAEAAAPPSVAAQTPGDDAR